MELVSDLKSWCRGEGLQEDRAVMVLAPEETETAKIEETMETIKCLGRVRVRGRRFSEKTSKLMVLCECRESVRSDIVPPEVLPIEGQEAWPIVMVGEQEATVEDFNSKLRALLRAEGKTEEDLQAFVTTTPPAAEPISATEALLRVVGDLLDKTSNPSSNSGGFRRLRIFSGNLPTPAGEEPFDHWLEQAQLMVEESDCSSKEKRRRIMESLKGPALETVKAVRVSDPDMSPAMCLEALERAFGTAESGEDLYFSFRLLQQKPKEKLSEFLRRLESSLTKVVQKGGLPADRADRARVEQLLRGGIEADLMLIRLRLRERTDKPPNFVDLLSEIRTEEEYEASRSKLNPSVQSTHAKRDDGKEAEIKNLKAEVKELRSMFATMSTNRPSVTEEEKVARPKPEHWQDPEVSALKKQVSELQHKLSNRQLRPRENQAAVMTVEMARPVRQRPPGPRSSSDEHFCYRCGDPGHYAATCQNAENQSKVIQKLIQSRKRSQVSGQRPPRDSGNVMVTSKKSAVEIQRGPNLPTGLIGAPSFEPVKVNGHLSTALLDSGSQVTIIFEGWYKKYIPDVPIYPVDGLDIWGLSESSYPYRGYVVVEMEFPQKVTGAPESISVLALICPTPRGPEQTPIIVGTNAKANLPKRLARLYGETVGVHLAHTVRVKGMEDVTTTRPTTLLDDTAEGDEGVGCVKWLGPGSLILQPGVSRPASCKVEFTQPVEKEILMIDASPIKPLPAGVLLTSIVVPSYAVDPNQFTVLLRNESLKEAVIPPGAVLGHVYTTDVVTSTHNKEPTSAEWDASEIDFGDSPLPQEWKERLRTKLTQRADVFSLHEWDVGLAKGVEHSIRMSDERPFRERSRRLAPADIDDVRRHIQELIAAGIIKESRSPYASPIVIARKKSGKVRMCIDYRTLNSRTIPDQYTTPRIDDALDCLSGSQWFSVLDLRSGYYQIAMKEEDKEKTAFICPLGFYQFERMPQGITGAPATFQRLMEKTVGDMNLLEVLVYLDDLIVFGRTLEEHEERLIKVLDRLREAGLKISLDKCQFGQSQVKYVGHIVSANGVATDPAKIETVTTWPQPTDLKTLRSFLGFCGYYRRFIANYSSIVRPLTELTKGYAPKQHGKRAVKDSNKVYWKDSEPFGERWNLACTAAFHQIINCLTHAPVLAFADPNKPYVLHVDASLSGLGAVLYQEYSEGLRPVAFASRKLSTSEKNYPIHQLEFLSLKWAVVNKFHDYLYGARFTVRTDNNPLTYVLTTAKLNATGHRWLADLSTYEFDIRYRPGKHNIDADLLSRQERGEEEEREWETISQAGVQSICRRVSVLSSPKTSPKYAEQLGARPECVPELYAFPTRIDVSALGQMSRSELKAAQKEDPVIGPTIKALKHGQWPEDLEATPEVSQMKRELGRLQLRDGLLHRTSKKPSGEESAQLVLPAVFRSVVLKSLHDDMGHLGIERTTDLLKARFYWPKMAGETEQYVKNCGKCVSRKSPCQRAAPLHQIQSNGPMDLVCIDFLSVEPDSKGVSNVLVVTDHFTRYAQAFPTKDQKALTVAKVLNEKFFVHYGLPARIHSDQGRDFESLTIREMLKVMGIRKSRTSPYHPQGDPQPERFNRTLLSMLGTLDPKKRSRWSEQVPHVVHAYNASRSDATGYSPYYLLYGREARLAVDVCFGTSPDGCDVGHHSSYVARLKEDLQKAYQLASATADKTHQRNKRAHDSRVKSQTLESGDRVLVKNLGLQGKHKLQSRWKEVPYVVVSQMPNLPVYRVKQEDGNGGIRTLHRDHLLPIGQQVRMEREESDHRPPPKPRTRADTRKKQSAKQSQAVTSTEEEDSEEDSINSSAESESEYERPRQRPYSTYLEDVLKQRRAAREQAVVPQEEEEQGGARTEEDEGPDRDENGEDESEEEEDESEEEIAQESESDIEEGQASSVEEEDSPERQSVARPKRTVKPVVRLTYDEPGKARDKPFTVVHRGVKIRIGKG